MRVERDEDECIIKTRTNLKAETGVKCPGWREMELLTDSPTRNGNEEATETDKHTHASRTISL